LREKQKGIQIYLIAMSRIISKYSKGPITWRTFNPGVELSPVNRVDIFCDYMDDFNPGVETLHYTFSASIPGSKKSLYFVFL
jgi:hypothetical protein